MGVRCLACLMALLVAAPITEAVALEKVPDKLVVLTFDDSVVSQHLVARPILKKYGFGATFFITEGFSFPTNKRDYLSWQQIAELHNDGFEIGNHTRDHMSVTEKSQPKLREQLEAINARCIEHGIPKPVSFAYPGNGIHPGGFAVLKELGIQFARRGGAPEFPYEWGRGFAYEPGVDHPLLIPSAGDARPDWTIEDFKRAVAVLREIRRNLRWRTQPSLRALRHGAHQGQPSGSVAGRAAERGRGGHRARAAEISPAASRS